jgi:hypothetical protein
MSGENRRKLIVRMKGGLGNQLFCYAAARAIALNNGFELVLDDVSGFKRDRQYRRTYALDSFKLSSRKATPTERLEPFERARRAVAKWRSRHLALENKIYVEEMQRPFQPELTTLRPTRDRYIDGYWQDERYFLPIESELRKDLQMSLELDQANRKILNDIAAVESVALHVRWFDPLALANGNISNLTEDYFANAIELVQKRVESPTYFLFSEYPEKALSLVRACTNSPLVVVDLNTAKGDAIKDFYLMRHCKHFITANSTFSWWAAWLGKAEASTVLVPARAPSMRGSHVLRFD